MQLSAGITRLSERMKIALDAADSSMAMPAASTASSESALTPPPKRSCGAGGSMCLAPVPSNVHGRLVALQANGSVEQFERIREKAVAIVGLGAVGTAAAEMLARSGVLSCSEPATCSMCSPAACTKPQLCWPEDAAMSGDVACSPHHLL